MKKYYVYYDSGTSNSRIYLLDEECRIVYTEKMNIGSKESAAAGDNLVLITCLYDLYRNMLDKTGIREEDLEPVFYASGMVTCPYGLLEVPHLVLPVTTADFAAALTLFREDKLFHRDFYLVPGLKTGGDDIALINNMRGEEIEILGTLDDLAARFGNRKTALIFPGSHTHTVLIDNGSIRGILSNMTGELYYAMKKDTILAPVLDIPDRELDVQMVLEGVNNLERFGFNRAVYICHAMRMFNRGTPAQRRSYCEGVLNGGYAKALAYYCAEEWKGCDLAVVASGQYMYELYAAVLSRHPYIREVAHLPISEGKSYAVEGLKKIIALRKGD